MIPLNPYSYIIAGVVALMLFVAGFGVGAFETTGKATAAALAGQKVQFDADRKADQDNFAKLHAADLAALAGDKKTNDALQALAAASGDILAGVNRAPTQTVCIKSRAFSAYVDGLHKYASPGNPGSVPSATPH